MAKALFLRSIGPGVTVTASFGLATCPDDGDTAEKVVQAADAAMYRVKGSTRNAVASAGG
jgi:GGDEF domain-containing protein